MNTFIFNKEQEHWYAVVPAWTGAKSELEMVCGAEKMLDKAAKGAETVSLIISETPFEGSDELLLIKPAKILGEYEGGGYYFLEMFEGELIILAMWLCHVTEFVFGKLPEKIYIKRA